MVSLPVFGSTLRTPEMKLNYLVTWVEQLIETIHNCLLTMIINMTVIIVFFTTAKEVMSMFLPVFVCMFVYE